MAQNYDKNDIYKEWVYLRFSQPYFIEEVKRIRKKCKISPLGFKKRGHEYLEWRKTLCSRDNFHKEILSLLEGRFSDYWFRSVKEYILFNQIYSFSPVHIRNSQNEVTGVDELLLVIEPEARVDDVVDLWWMIEGEQRGYGVVKERIKITEDFDLNREVVDQRIYGKMRYKKIQENIREKYGYFQVEELENIVKEWKKRVRE